MNYSRIRLHHPFNWWPGWTPTTGTPRDRWEYAAPDFAVTRDAGEPAYHVVHVESGERAEVPCSNVRGAVLMGGESP